MVTKVLALLNRLNVRVLFPVGVPLKMKGKKLSVFLAAR